LHSHNAFRLCRLYQRRFYVILSYLKKNIHEVHERLLIKQSFQF